MVKQITENFMEEVDTTSKTFYEVDEIEESAIVYREVEDISVLSFIVWVPEYNENLTAKTLPSRCKLLSTDTGTCIMSSHYFKRGISPYNRMASITKVINKEFEFIKHLLRKEES